MANISSITLPNGTVYGLKGVPDNFVIGTQAAATNVWTGSLPTNVTDYYNGLTIDYFLPFAGNSSGATLNLGGKGAKPVYVGNGNSAVTNHYPQYSVIHLTYIVNSALNSGNGCWKATAYQNSTYYYTTAYSGTAAGTAAKAASVSYYTLQKGYIPVMFIYDNTAAGALTLNINSTGAKPLYINGAPSSASNYTVPKGVYIVYYDGTNYHLRTDGKLPGETTGNLPLTGGNVTGPVNFGDSVTIDSAEVGDIVITGGLSAPNNVVTVGSASAGTAIAADDITGWTTNVPTAVTKKTVVTSVTPATVVTGGTTTDVPNISKKTVVTGVTKKTVVTSASGGTASYSGGVLTLTNTSFGTGDSVTVTTGDSVTVGTAIKAYTGLTTGAAATVSTGDSVSVTAGTAASLSYTARSIPNISVTNKDVLGG